MLLKKNMSRFLYIFAFGTLLSVLYISDVGSAPITKFIIDEIRDDNNICPTPWFLYKSTYVNQCTKIKYPSELLNISEDSFNTFLCLGVYDISYQICHLKSRHPNITLLPKDENDFNLQLNKLVPPDIDPLKFCKQQQFWKYSPLYKKVQREVTMLSNAFKDPLKCERICFDFNNKFNPLCSILVWAAQLPIPGISTFDQQNSIVSIKNKSNKDNQTSHKMSSATVLNSPISESEDTKNEKNKPNEPLLPGKENSSQVLINDHQPKIPSKDNGKAQASNTSSSDAVQHHQDSEIGNESLNTDKTNKNLDTKSESSIDNTNNKFKDLEKSSTASTDKKNIDPSQKMKNIGASISEAVTLPQYTDDQKNVNQEDLSGETGDGTGVAQETSNLGPSLPKPSEIKDTFSRNPSIRIEDDSHFFTYFVVITLLCIGGYVGYHNKQKVLAIFLEGRRSRGSRGRRRPNTASYRKLDCTLEEAVTSQCNSNVTHVIY